MSGAGRELPIPEGAESAGWMIVSPERRGVTAVIPLRSRASGRVIECSGEGPLCHLLAEGLRMGLEPDIGQQLTQAV
jgi:hypothetical protein